jgi:catechol 2,3-dioxygenase-like lactoylglutathione lyase family enzyme
MIEPRLSLVTLAVADVERARAFYSALGWRPSSIGGDEVAFFQLGPIALALYGAGSMAADLGAPAGAPGAVWLAQNVRDRAEVDRALAAAEAAGARIVKPAADAPWGGYVGYFADPDGHVWEIAWNPGFQLAADGALRLPA